MKSVDYFNVFWVKHLK